MKEHILEIEDLKQEVTKRGEAREEQEEEDLEEEQEDLEPLELNMKTGAVLVWAFWPLPLVPVAGLWAGLKAALFMVAVQILWMALMVEPSGSPNTSEHSMRRKSDNYGSPPPGGN